MENISKLYKLTDFAIPLVGAALYLKRRNERLRNASDEIAYNHESIRSMLGYFPIMVFQVGFHGIIGTYLIEGLEKLTN